LKPPEKLIVAISSQALFDLRESNAIYDTQGVESYAQYQIAHENEPLKAGVAFPLVKKLLALNQIHNGTSFSPLLPVEERLGVRAHISSPLPPAEERSGVRAHLDSPRHKLVPAQAGMGEGSGVRAPLVEVILLSRNSADTGLRIFNSIAKHNLDIKCAAFTSGRNPYSYGCAFRAHLFLSTNPEDVRSALAAGCAAATILESENLRSHSEELRIAFDGDAVLFSDESQKIFDAQGLKAFENNEKQTATQPLPGGPFKNFLSCLHQIQKQFSPQNCPIRTALITARSAPAHERVIHTLRAWNIRIDEALFLGGKSKVEFLQAFQADFFFDDQRVNCEAARNFVPTGHVPQTLV
jgi:5'-nucleotidase